MSASQDGNLLVWDAVTQQKTRLIPLKSSWVMTCAFSPAGTHVASGGLDNICTVYDLEKQVASPGEHAQILSGHTGCVELRLLFFCQTHTHTTHARCVKQLATRVAVSLQDKRQV